MGLKAETDGLPEKQRASTKKPPEEPESSADFTIRAARQDDVERLVALEEESFSADRVSRRSFRRFISGRTDILLVASDRTGLIGYALVLFRRGTALARLYSIAVCSKARGRGIGAALLDASEAGALKRGAMMLRLEVREDNERAIKLYRERGYREFGRYEDYYEDHAPALRFEKILKFGLPERSRLVPHYVQTTEFTCGPAAMMMVMATFDRKARFDRAKELRLWRETTTVFMTSGHGGCEPVGIAVSLAKRGYDAEIFASQRGPYFLESVRNTDKREVMELTQKEFSAEAKQLGVRRHQRGLKAAEIAAMTDNGALAIVLVSGYRMFDERFPHWLVVHGHAGKHLFVHDPWVDPDFFENSAAAMNLPIPMKEFDRMAQYGRNRLRAAVIVKGRRPT